METPDWVFLHFVCVCVYVCFHRTCHTTRGSYFGEENGIDYHFVSEEDFQNMIHMVSSLVIEDFS